MTVWWDESTFRRLLLYFACSGERGQLGGSRLHTPIPPKVLVVCLYVGIYVSLCTCLYVYYLCCWTQPANSFYFSVNSEDIAFGRRVCTSVPANYQSSMPILTK